MAILKIHLRTIFNVFLFLPTNPNIQSSSLLYSPSSYLSLLSIMSHCQFAPPFFCNSVTPLPRLSHVLHGGSWKQRERKRRRQMEQEHVRNIFTVWMTIFVSIKPACMLARGFTNNWRSWNARNSRKITWSGDTNVTLLLLPVYVNISRAKRSHYNTFNTSQPLLCYQTDALSCHCHQERSSPSTVHELVLGAGPKTPTTGFRVMRFPTCTTHIFTFRIC